jgi:hypothetical protein
MRPGNGARRRRGEPLAALALLLVGWTGARMILWQSPFAPPFIPAAATPAELAAGTLSQRESKWLPTQDSAPMDFDQVALHPPVLELPIHMPAPGAAWSKTSDLPFSTMQQWPSTVSQFGQSEHVMVRARTPKFAEPATITNPQSSNEDRWRFDSWFAWRSGSGIPLLASGARAPSYGGTQAGAAARDDHASGAHHPAVHVRATYAPDRPQQAELAAGAGLRPLVRIPVRVIAEARLTRSEGRTEARPAAFAVTELAPIGLPLGLMAEGYAQAGWVGGRYSTAFADGQVRLTRAVATVGPARIRLGAGAWGGAQKFAERIDLGPTVAFDLANGAVAARLSLDYRFQVAGNATPGDGVALTLSTGF